MIDSKKVLKDSVSRYRYNAERMIDSFKSEQFTYESKMLLWHEIKGGICELTILAANFRYMDLFEELMDMQSNWVKVRNDYIDSCEPLRICSECGKPMVTGYVINDGEEYYCSDECLHKHYSAIEYNNMYADGCAYWTTFEE